MRPRTGDVLLIESSNASAIPTRVGTFSKLSHAETLYIPDRFPDDLRKWETVSAEWPTMKRLPFSRYKGNTVVHFYRVDCSDAQAYRAYTRAAIKARKRVRYSAGGLAYVGAMKAVRLFGILKLSPLALVAHAVAERLPNPFVGSRDIFCSYSVQEDCEPEVGRFCAGISPSMVTPEDIARSPKTREIARYARGRLTID